MTKFVIAAQHANYSPTINSCAQSIEIRRLWGRFYGTMKNGDVFLTVSERNLSGSPPWLTERLLWNREKKRVTPPADWFNHRFALRATGAHLKKNPAVSPCSVFYGGHQNLILRLLDRFCSRFSLMIFFRSKPDPACSACLLLSYQQCWYCPIPGNKSFPSPWLPHGIAHVSDPIARFLLLNISFAIWRS